MANILNFSSDKIDIFLFVIDKSTSMEKDERNVIDGLKMYKKSFENFPEANSIAVSVSKFSNSYYPEDFKRISEFDTSYYADGATALYYSIVKSAEQLKDYIEEVTQQTGCIPTATYILFSDGEPYNDRMNRNQAKRAIEELNYAGITTVFVAFGEAISSEFGQDLGFVSTINVNDRETLVNFLGVELSNSCKEQSKSLKALGANFFSQAAGSEDSEAYSQTTAQAIEDNSWFDDIEDI